MILLDHRPPPEPTDALADLLTARPHLATLNTVALAVREGARAS